MVCYHITDNHNIEICKEIECRKTKHFDKLSNALMYIENKFEGFNFNKKNLKIQEYLFEINYSGNKTHHYEMERGFREKELIRLLGNGKRIKAFIVKESENNIQIHELLDNGILVVYSYFNHRKITLFTPTPERIFYLYFSIGQFPPEYIIEKSDLNFRMGYNSLFSE